jgi:hypothetical protein
VRQVHDLEELLGGEYAWVRPSPLLHTPFITSLIPSFPYRSVLAETMAYRLASSALSSTDGE